MSKIKVKTNGNALSITSRPVITSGSRNIDTVAVVLDRGWLIDGARYYVNFYRDNYDNGIITELEMVANEGSCFIPYAVIENEGFFHFGIFAKTEENFIIKTSENVAYEVKRGTKTTSFGELKETAFEVNRNYIRLMNDYSRGLCLDEEMSFDDVSLNYANYMSIRNVTVDACGFCMDKLYEIINKYVNPSLEHTNEIVAASAFYINELKFFFENAEMEQDSINEETLRLQLEISSTINSMYTLYTGGNDDG